MRHLVSIFAVALIVSVSARASALSSCGTGGVVAPHHQMVPFQGSVFHVTTPASYDPSKPWPLMLGLHGDEGDPTLSVVPDWSSVTDDRFIFVAPRAPNPGGSWYQATDTNSAWLDALMQSLLASYNVDLDRISIWGLSGGAIFLSDYALQRQGVFAAVEFNMGGGYYPTPYYAPPRPECKIPARFVASMTDFTRPDMRALFDMMTSKQHVTVWADAPCSGHCWDQTLMGPNARDWLLVSALCGATSTPGCRPNGTASDGGTALGDAGPPPMDAQSSGARLTDGGALATDGASFGGNDAAASPESGGRATDAAGATTSHDSGAVDDGDSSAFSGGGGAQGPRGPNAGCGCGIPAEAGALQRTALASALLLLGGLTRRRRKCAKR